MVHGEQISGRSGSSNCKGCVACKAPRAPIPKVCSFSRARKILDLIHTDLCGPIEVGFIGGARYFTTFIGDDSSWVVVYSISRKSDAGCCFKIFKILQNVRQVVRLDLCSLTVAVNIFSRI